MARDDLSEAAACAHWSAISWVSGTETFSCIIPFRLIDGALPLTRDRPAAIAELVREGYWRVHDNGDVELVDHKGHVQKSLINVEKKRANDAVSQQKQRAKRKAEEAERASQPSGTESGTDAWPDSVIVSAPRLPTDLTTRQEKEAVPEQRSSETCQHCGRLSAYVDGGYCRRAECRIAARGRAS